MRLTSLTNQIYLTTIFQLHKVFEMAYRSKIIRGIRKSTVSGQMN